jgi:pyridoxal phosphate enzyme (YggS family)
VDKVISAEESAQNYFKYKKRIEDLCEKSGKWETGVELLCATKTVSGERINEIRSLTGLDLIGENRVQELLEKYDVLDKEGLRIHFIGKLQSNKVKYIIEKASLIHSLDSLPLAEEIERQAAMRDMKARVLIEVNSGGEDAKGGVMPEAVEEFYLALAKFPHIEVCGLMTMGPVCEDEEEIRPYFALTKRIFDDIKTRHGFVGEGILSMGMSDSYRVAIEEGSTLVRIGRRLFKK